MPSYVAGQRLYLDADKSRVLEEGNPDAAYLLVAEGQELDFEVALKYGLAVEEPTKGPELPPSPADEPADESPTLDEAQA